MAIRQKETVVLDYDLRSRDVSCINVSKKLTNQSYQFAALGMGLDIKILRCSFDSNSIGRAIESVTWPKFAQDKHVIVNDLLWNPIETTKLLVGYRNGLMRYFQLADGAYAALSQEWHFKYGENVINRFSWNPLKPSTFAVAVQDNNIKLYDTRSQTAAGEISEMSAVDLSFHPTMPEMILVATKDRAVTLWDRRYQAQPMLIIDGKVATAKLVSWYGSVDPMSFVSAGENKLRFWEASNCSVSSGTTPTVKKTIDSAQKVHEVRLTGTVRSIALYGGLGQSQLAVHCDNVPANKASIGGKVPCSSSSHDSTFEGSSIAVYDRESSFMPLSILDTAASCMSWILPADSETPATFIAVVSCDGHFAVQDIYAGRRPRDVSAGISAVVSTDVVAMSRPQSALKGHILTTSVQSSSSVTTPWAVSPLDPLVIKQLVKEYRLPFDFDSEAQTLCKFNANAALTYNLRCRASLWIAFSALMPQSSSSSGSGLSCAEDVLWRMLHQLMEVGDVLHFTLLRETLRFYSPQFLLHDDAMRIRETYNECGLLLRRLQCADIAVQLLQYLDDPVLKQRLQADTTIALKCGRCRKDLPAVDASSRRGVVYCGTCHVNAASCSLCMTPVSRGMYIFCPGCAHGGHISCLEQWFHGGETSVAHGQCPAGCGHVCFPAARKMTVKTVVVSDAADEDNDHGIEATATQFDRHDSGDGKRKQIVRRAQLARFIVNKTKAAIINVNDYDVTKMDIR